MGAGDGYGESGGFEDFGGGFGGCGEEVVVEGVGPEEDGLFFAELRSAGRPRAAVPT
jgi:hypothetical protein